MEKDRSFKMLAVVALVVAIAGVSIGFASYSRTFLINTQTVTINGTANKFDANGLYISKVEKAVSNETLVNANVGTLAVTAQGADGNNTWSGMTASFDDNTPATQGGSATGDSYVKFTATISNTTQYAAYLNQFALTSTGLSCAAAEGEEVDADVLAAFCSKVLVTATPHATSALAVTAVENAGYALTPDASATTLTVPAFGTATVEVEVRVDKTAVYPDGKVIVTLPTLEFGYTSAKTGVKKSA